MVQKGYPFDGVPMAEAEWTLLFRHMLGDGVLAGEMNQLDVFADSTGMQVKVRTGRAFIRGHFYENDAEVTLSIATSNGTNPRIDRVVLRIDWTANTILLAVLTGTPAASPVAPALTQSATVWELPLATVAVGAGVSTITAGNVLMTGQRTFAAHRLILSTTGAAFVPFHAGNDGAGSGLDADTLDGLTSGQFARSDVAQTIAPLWNFTTNPTVNGNPLWHTGNDGAGSGLDADTVDGSHGSSFATAGHTHPHSHAEYLPLTGGVVSGLSAFSDIDVVNLDLLGRFDIDNSNPDSIRVGNVNINSQVGLGIIVRNHASGAILGYIPLFNA